MTAVPGQADGRTSVTLGELAIRFGCPLQGDPDVRVSHVGSLEAADGSAVAFIANPSYRKFLATTGAGVVVLDPSLAGECTTAALLTKNPHALYARIAALLHPPPVHAGGVHRTACVDESAVVHADAWIGPMAVIEAGAHIGARVAIGPGCVIMRGARVGADSRLVAGVTLCHDVQIGERVLMHPGVVIGADGFGLAMDRGQWLKVPQVGSVEIGDDVEIGANTTIDRGAIENTVICAGVKLDNQIQVGHNVRIGAHTAIAACSGISGSTTIGERCMFGGQTGVAGHLTICDDVVITGKSLVTGNINKPGVYSGGLPVDDAARFRKNAARFNQLDELARQVRRLRRDPGGSSEPKS